MINFFEPHKTFYQLRKWYLPKFKIVKPAAKPLKAKKK